MRRIIILIGIAALTLPSTIIAQDAEALQEFQDLYWNYRQRLQDEFIRIDWGGDGIGDWNNVHENKYDKAGYSVPAGGKIPFGNCQSPGLYWEYVSFPEFDGVCVNQPAEIRGDDPGVIKWGDGTYHLGHYLSVLATEYALLAQGDDQEAIDKTIEEMYLALQACRRLDLSANRMAQQYLDDNGVEWTPDLSGQSGYSLRSDAAGNIWQDFNRDDINCALDRYANCNEFHPEVSVLSQDQILGLLFGFTFIKRFVPPEVEHNGHSILGMAQSSADGLMKRVSDGGWWLRTPCISCNPNAIDLFCANSDNGLAALGCNAFFNGYNMDRAFQYINGYSYMGQDEGFLSLMWILQSLVFNLGLFDGGTVNLMLYITAATSGNDFISRGYTNKCFAKGKYIYPITRDILYEDFNLTNGQRNNAKQKMEALFAVAPEGGPCLPADGLYDCDADYEWRSANRWWHTIGGGDLAPSEWNGLDYMLGYNLYHLYYWPNEEFNTGARSEGREEESSTVLLKTPIDFNVHPNPASGEVHINANQGQALNNIRIMISDQSGRVLLDQWIENIEDAGVLDLSQYPEGMYFIQVANETGESVSRRVVKVK